VRSRILFVLAGVVSFSVAAQFANAASAHANIVNAQGTQIGTAKLTPSGQGVKVSVKVSQLTPGDHGVHNTNSPRPHVGDLPNLMVGKNGKASTSFTLVGATLGDGTSSLFHEGGTALVIHAKADDLISDPSGNSGDRIACGVIEK